MPRFHFNVEDGSSLPDLEGTELPSLEAAKAEAVKLAGALLKEGDGQFWNRGEEWQMTVTDGGPTPLFTLRFSAEMNSE